MDELTERLISRVQSTSTDDDLLAGRRMLAEGNAERRAAAEQHAKDNAAADKAAAAAQKQAADAEALRLRAEIRLAYTGSSAEFERAYPALLATYRERQTWRNLEQARTNAREQVRRIA